MSTNLILKDTISMDCIINQLPERVSMSADNIVVTIKSQCCLSCPYQIPSKWLVIYLYIAVLMWMRPCPFPVMIYCIKHLRIDIGHSQNFSFVLWKFDFDEARWSLNWVTAHNVTKTQSFKELVLPSCCKCMILNADSLYLFRKLSKPIFSLVFLV